VAVVDFPGAGGPLGEDQRWADAGPALKELIQDPVLGYAPHKEGERLPPKSARVPRKAEWRQVVLSRARRARHELLAALESPGKSARSAEQAAEHLLKARDAALQRVWPWSWFEGCAQEQAWLSVHEAEVQILELVPPQQLPVYADDILNKADRVLCGDRRALCVEELRNQGKSDEDLRTPLVHLARAVHDARDDRFAQTRDCRNRLIRLTSVALWGILVALVAGAMGRLDFNVDGSRSIPRGWETIVLVVLFGVVGALVTAVPPLAKADGKRNPFSLPLFQALVKLAMGPLFALVGVLVLQDKVISGLQAATSLRGLLIWATVFGAAQQTVTHFIDQRIGGLLHEAPASPSSKAR